MSDNIPNEIQVEIIKKLPIKSLIQFRSVSKTWRSLIDSSQFISEYQKQTHLQQYLLVGDAFGYNYVSYLDNDTFPHQKISLTLPDSVLTFVRPLILGSSQGLFCFYNIKNAAAIIWNPTIRKSVDVVVPKALDGRSYTTVVGFGVSPRTLDPMLVKISTETYGPIENLMNTTWAVEVFRLSSGVWKSLCVDLPWSIAVEWNQVVIDKFIYWHAFERIRCYDLIISFDMISVEFKEIRLPDSILGVNVGAGIEFKICKLKESLVVLQRDCENGFSPDLGVWMMDNDDPKSFERIYTIKRNIPGALILSVLAFNRNGDAIVETIHELDEDEEDEDEEEYELFFYKPNSQHVNLTISAQRSAFCVHSYTGTLLLLDH